jgi:hypothetical protein
MNPFLFVVATAVLTVFLQPIANDCWQHARTRWPHPLGRRFGRALAAFWEP